SEAGEHSARRSQLREIDNCRSDQRASERRARSTRPKQSADRCQAARRIPSCARTIEQRALAIARSGRTLSWAEVEPEFSRTSSATRRHGKPDLGRKK